MVAETSLRALWAAVTGIVARHGEPYMQGGPRTDAEERLDFAVKALTEQLVDCKRRLGEKPEVNLEAADREYDELKRRDRSR